MSSIAARVVSYNLLSSRLSSPSYYTHNKSKDLDAKTRFERIQAKFDDEIPKSPIICVQEVPIDWQGDLHVYFQKKGYNFVDALYGSYFNGFMGVGIAYPYSKYDLVGASIHCVSDGKKWPREPQPSTVSQCFYGVYDWLIKTPISIVYSVITWLVRPLGALGFSKVWPFNRKYYPQEDAFAHAKRRNNRMVTLQLKPKDTTTTEEAESKDESNSSSTAGTFFVSTYHMPCAFYNPPVMVIHSALAAQIVQKTAGSAPYILAGDFNIKPGDAAYKLLTEGELDESDPSYPTPKPYDSWRPKLKEGMRSSYKEKNGKEPLFTNYAQTRGSEEFIDTLDYIFLSSHIDVSSVMSLPSKSELGGPLPNAEEPSDHLMIAADLQIHAEQN